MGGTRATRLSVAIAAICVLAAGCGSSDSGDSGGGGSSSTSASAAAPKPIPASPVTANDKASEDAFAQTLEQDPCPSELSDAVLGILQTYQQKYRAFPGVDWSGISVDSKKSQSLTGIPQCTFTVMGADPISTITFAAVTAEANKVPAGDLKIADVVEPADPSIPVRGQVVEPPCQITQEFLGRLQATGKPAQWTTGYRDLAVSIQVANGDPGIAVAQWKNHLVLAKRGCADTRSAGATPGNSPDWIIQVDADDTGHDFESTRKILDNVAGYLADWTAGKPVQL